MDIRVNVAARSLSRVASLHVAIGGNSEVNIFRYIELSENGAVAYGFGSDNVYAYADYLNVDYIASSVLKAAPKILQAVIANLQQCQDPETGLFNEASHHPIHTTACAVAALARHGRRPLHKVSAIQKYRDWNEFVRQLDAVRWSVNPWRDSNIPSGIATILGVTEPSHAKGMAQQLFDWLDENVDRDLGLWRKGEIKPEPNRGYFTHIAAAFHFLFLYRYFARDFSWKSALYRQCLHFVQNPDIMGFCREPGFIEIDCFYCMLLCYQDLMEPEEFRKEVSPFVERYIGGLTSWAERCTSSDIHKLIAALAMLAEIERLGPASGKAQLRSIFQDVPYI